MMAGHGSDSVGGPARHIPVLLPEVLAALAPLEGRRIVDGTFGAGGYSRALLDAGAEVIALDRDPNVAPIASMLAEDHPDRFRFVAGEFSSLDRHVDGLADGVVLDIGVSSMQLDEAERGFSFRQDGPLDMRMAQSGTSAADVVNGAERSELTRIFGILGEERHASRVAKMIVQRRAEAPFERTGDLAGAIADLMPRKPGERIHPATRAFQGLRIYVNDELGQLVAALEAAERALAPGGRLAVVTFHSLEDRIVKRFLQQRSGAPAVSRHMPDIAGPEATFADSRGAVEPGEDELSANPRSRSARLRSGTRTDAPARDVEDRRSLGLPGLRMTSIRRTRP